MSRPPWDKTRRKDTTMPKCKRCNGQVISQWEELRCISCGYDQTPKIQATDKIRIDALLDRKADVMLESLIKERTQGQRYYYGF